MVAAFAEHERRYARKTAKEVVEAFCDRTGLTLEDLKGRSLVRAIAHPRQELMSLLRDAGKSTTWIGQYLGGRDHSTVVLGVKAHKKRQGAQ